jgi:UDP-N-acetylglucosamine 4,6-dehydratase
MTLTGSVLITGGSGTLGNAIVRTAERERWDATFTIYSRSESRQAAMRSRHPLLRYVLGDVRDAERVHAVVPGHDVVIHAAALKRIPECEAQPSECIKTNVVGTQHVALACARHNVKSAIFISTDKACRAITTSGASKLIGEGIWRAFAQHGPFTAVRYGNVVASTGSVIPLWRQQAKRGEALTITDRRCTRFFMAPSDAVALIKQAYTIIRGAIVVPKMRSLSLLELAAIVAPGCSIVETGLRSTEKLHEDLIHEDELVLDKGAGFVLTERGQLGHRYTSYEAPRLSAPAFRAMLGEAESYD